MSEILLQGKNGIYAKILRDSLSVAGKRLVTMELSYPRIILAEVNTHRMFSRNSSSSRAIPFEKILKQLDGRPVRFGANQAGMQDKGEDNDALIEGKQVLDAIEAYFPQEAWEAAREDAIFWAKAFADAGYHKQICNRLVEPFQMMKTVISATEWDNFFWLRNDSAADPSLEELARCMYEAYNESTPKRLLFGEWHLPYVDVEYQNGVQLFYVDGIIVSLEDAIKVSCARCAAVSFRNTDYGVEKSKEVYNRLVGSDRKHASAFEHCATPIATAIRNSSNHKYSVNLRDNPSTWEVGISNMDREGNLWSGNFNGFIQYRKLIPGENYKGKL